MIQRCRFGERGIYAESEVVIEKATIGKSDLGKWTEDETWHVQIHPV